MTAAVPQVLTSDNFQMEHYLSVSQRENGHVKAFKPTTGRLPQVVGLANGAIFPVCTEWSAAQLFLRSLDHAQRDRLLQRLIVVRAHVSARWTAHGAAEAVRGFNRWVSTRAAEWEDRCIECSIKTLFDFALRVGQIFYALRTAWICGVGFSFSLSLALLTSIPSCGKAWRRMSGWLQKPCWVVWNRWLSGRRSGVVVVPKRPSIYKDAGGKCLETEMTRFVKRHLNSCLIFVRRGKCRTKTVWILSTISETSPGHATRIQVRRQLHAWFIELKCPRFDFFPLALKTQ